YWTDYLFSSLVLISALLFSGLRFIEPITIRS
ncbi:MAG: hypothetical protein ACI8UC_001999, partial [Psychromonas sp.]